MAKFSNPFFDGDFGKFDVASFLDPKKMAEQMEAFDLSKVAGQFNVPGVDPEALAQSHRKNVEAFTNANRVALEGAWALMQRQTEIMRQAMEDTSKTVTEFAGVEQTPENVAKELEALKKAYAKALTNARELAEMTTKSQTEAVELINARVTEGLDEIKAGLKKNGAAKK